MGNNPSSAFVAIFVILLLALVLRWAFRPARNRPIVRPVDAAQSPDLGLLTVVAVGLPRVEAMHRRAMLGNAGMRSSMSKRRDGNFDVLVFHADAPRARVLLEP